MSIKNLLNKIFAEDFPALLNPMRKIVSERYSAKKGKAFTVQEERKIIEFCLALQEENEYLSKACLDSVPLFVFKYTPVIGKIDLCKF